MGTTIRLRRCRCPYIFRREHVCAPTFVGLDSWSASPLFDPSASAEGEKNPPGSLGRRLPGARAWTDDAHPESGFRLRSSDVRSGQHSPYQALQQRAKSLVGLAHKEASSQLPAVDGAPERSPHTPQTKPLPPHLAIRACFPAKLGVLFLATGRPHWAMRFTAAYSLSRMSWKVLRWSDRKLTLLAEVYLLPGCRLSSRRLSSSPRCTMWNPRCRREATGAWSRNGPSSKRETGIQRLRGRDRRAVISQRRGCNPGQCPGPLCEPRSNGGKRHRARRVRRSPGGARSGRRVRVGRPDVDATSMVRRIGSWRALPSPRAFVEGSRLPGHPDRDTEPPHTRHGADAALHRLWRIDLTRKAGHLVVDGIRPARALRGQARADICVQRLCTSSSSNPRSQHLQERRAGACGQMAAWRERERGSGGVCPLPVIVKTTHVDRLSACRQNSGITYL